MQKVNEENDEAATKEVDDQMELLKIFAHDIKMPLSIMLSASEIIESNFNNPEKILKYNNLIKSNVYKLIRFSQMVCSNEISRKDNAQAEIISLNKLVDALIKNAKEFFKQDNIAIQFDCKSERCEIYSKLALAEGCILNLLSNAYKASPSGETVKLNLWSNKKHVFLSVSDNGKGIPPQSIPNLFKYGYYDTNNYIDKKSKSHCSGMGLKSVYKAAHTLNGRIKVFSKVGRGTCFVLRFPSNAAPKPADCMSQDLGDNYFSQVKIEFYNILND